MAFEVFKMMGVIAINRDKVFKDLKAIKTQADKTSKAMGASFQKFAGYVEKHSDQIKKAGRTLTIFGGIATAAFALSVKSAAAFEEQLANVSTMLDESAMKILPEYRNELQRLSVNFGESTQTLSKGLYDILSASIPPAEALRVLEISATAAAAGITDTGVAADAITTILNSYGMSADQAGIVSDKLFAIVKEGKTTFGELAPAIGTVAATASMAGLDFDNLGAAIATLTRAGIDTNEAMTSINGVLRAFLGPTEEAAKMAKDVFGFALDTVTLKTMGLTGVMEKLKNATAEQLSVIFPNIRALKGIAAALGDAEGYARSYALMLNSAGLTQEAFEKQSATLNFKLGQLKEMFNLIKVTVGDALIPTIKDLTAQAMGIIGRIKEWIDENKPLFETLVKVGAGLGIIMLVLGPMLMILPGLIVSLGLLKIAFLPFLIGGLIIAGLIKLSEYLGNIKIKAFEAATAFREWDLDKLNTGISEVEKIIDKLEWELKKAEKGFTLFGLTLKNQDVNIGRLKQTIKDYNIELGLLEERREELIETEKEGIDVSEDKLKLDKEIAEMQDEIKEKLEEEKNALEEKTNAEEIATAGKELGLKIYELTHTAMENSVRLLDDEKQRLIKLGIEKKLINDWYVLEIKRLEELYEKETKVVDVTKLLSLEMQILTAQYKLTNQTEKVTIQYYQDMLGIVEELVEVKKEERDVLVEGTPKWNEANLAYLEARINAKDLKETLDELNQVKNKELKGLKLVNAQLSILEVKYHDIVKDAEYLIQKTSLLNEKYVLLNRALDETDFHSQEWFDLKEQIIVIEDELGNLEGAIDTSAQRWSEFFTDLKDKYTDSIGAIQSSISKFVSAFEGAIVDSLTALWNMAETNAEIQAQMAETEQEYIDEKVEMNEQYQQALMDKLAEYVDEKELANLTIAELETLLKEHSISAYEEMSEANQAQLEALSEKYDEILEEMESEQVTFGSILEGLWSKLVDAIITELIRLAAFYILKWVLSIVGIVLPFGKGGGIGYKLGGEVGKLAKTITGYNLGGLIKGLQLGGRGTDTVPTMLTPGEYVISEPMTSFIKRTGIVTDDLVSAIRIGARTPTPSFAVGGTVPSVISNPVNNRIIIEGISVSIYAQELNDETIANAGSKMFTEFERQLSMRGKVLVEE